jgi:aminopeptidase N
MKFLPGTFLIWVVFLLGPRFAQAQSWPDKPRFSRADSLRGTLSPVRTCYDVYYYHLNVRLDIDQRALRGSNRIYFTATRAFRTLQVDLFANLRIERITYKGRNLPFRREYNAVFVTFPATIRAGSRGDFTVHYAGNPRVAQRAPWDGGLVFEQDSLGKPWVATACQGIGASVWWPCKDHQADEVDSMQISVSVPPGLKDVSNGRLRRMTPQPDGYTRFDWFVANPINNYNVALNVGDYAHFSDTYMGEKGPLTLDCWVLPQNLERARLQFAQNVKPMLKSFEYWFGPYPFYEDGYKIIETPYLGMEHQSAVAYGNQYLNGYRGRDLSGTGWGLTWDFIVIHESGHEWFGNNITAKDEADKWIHESFTNYAESLFIESRFDKEAGQEYVHGTRRAIRNDAPIIAPYGVNQSGSGDMYYKGGNLLNMVRVIINNDATWRQILRGLNETFSHQTVTTKQIVDYINRHSGHDLTTVFDQYLRHRNIPTLETRFERGQLLARWISDVPGFDMPVRVRVRGGTYRFIRPTDVFQPFQVPGVTAENLEVDTFNYYIGVLHD